MNTSIYKIKMGAGVSYEPKYCDYCKCGPTDHVTSEHNLCKVCRENKDVEPHHIDDHWKHVKNIKE